MKNFDPHLHILPDSQKKLWAELSSVPKHFVLYGGTAIAVRLGHRQSVDFDFFSDQHIDDQELFENISFLRDSETIQMEKNTLSVLVDREQPIKVSFFGGLTFGRVEEPEIPKGGEVLIASIMDLLGHKLKVILQRAEAKDYIDIAALLRSGIKLEEGLEAAKALFGNSFPPMECLKALTYFEDGDLPTLNTDDRSLLVESTQSVPKSLSAKSLISKKLS